jgi:hypothetical protein
MILPDRALVSEADRRNLPRQVRDARGDFVAQTRVTASFGPAAVPGEAAAIQSAGLVVEGGDAVLSLRVTAWHRPGEGAGGCNVALTFLSPSLNFQLDKGDWPCHRQGSVYLRLGRRGRQVLAAFSEDGERWHEWVPKEVTLPHRLKVGVAAQNLSGTKFEPRFDRLRLCSPTR